MSENEEAIIKAPSPSKSTRILEEKTGIAVLLNIPTSIRKDDVETYIQMNIEDLVPEGDLENYNPRIFISYATGTRLGQDDEKCGPGMYYTRSLVDCFKNLGGWQTFTGLHVGPFVDWEEHYIGKLEKKVADVLILVLTPAFFRSEACLKETYAAIKNGVRIIPVSFEHPWVGDDGPWPTETTTEQVAMKEMVMAELRKTNSHPKPPSTVLENPANDLIYIYKKVNEILRRTPYFHPSEIKRRRLESVADHLQQRPANSTSKMRDKGSISLSTAVAPIKPSHGDWWLSKVREDGLDLQYAPEYIQNDKVVVMAAVQQNGLALKHTSLQNDTAVVMAAVQQSGTALKYAAPELKNDKAVVLTAISNSADAIKYVLKLDLKRDVDVLIAAGMFDGNHLNRVRRVSFC